MKAMLLDKVAKLIEVVFTSKVLEIFYCNFVVCIF